MHNRFTKKGRGAAPKTAVARRSPSSRTHGGYARKQLPPMRCGSAYPQATLLQTASDRSCRSTLLGDGSFLPYYTYIA